MPAYKVFISFMFMVIVVLWIMYDYWKGDRK
jgi:hypothetical protein